MNTVLRRLLPESVSGLSQVRGQLLKVILALMTVGLVAGLSLWATLGGQIQGLSVMQPRMWYLGLAAITAFACSYALVRWWRYEAGASLLVIVVAGFIFLVDYPVQVTRGRGLLLVSIPIALSAAVLPSLTTLVIGAITTIVTVVLSLSVLRQPPDYLGLAGLLLVTAICWIGAIGLEVTVRALENNLQTRQGAQEALRKRLAMEHLLTQLSTRLIALQPDDIPTQIRWALQIIGQHLGADRCYISLLSASGDITSHVYEWHDPAVPTLETATRGRALDSLIWARVRFAGSEGLAIEDVSSLGGASDIERSAWAGLGIQGILAMPMVLQQTLLGFIACNAERVPRGWSDDEAQLLQLAAGILANVLARGRAEVELSQSEERVKLALAGADLGSYDLNLETDELFVDERYLGMLGYKPNEIHLTIDSFLNLVHPEDRERIDRLFIKYRKTKDRVAEAEYRMLGKDGEYRWIQDRGRTIRRQVDNQPVRISGTHLDITSRKQMEEDIRAAEVRYRNLVEHLPAVVYLRNSVETVYISPQVADMYGYTQEEYLVSPTRWMEFIHPDDQKRVQQAVQELAQGRPVDLEYRVCRKDGRIIWVHDTSDQVVDGDARGGHIQGIIQDITARVEAEQVIHESQANLRLAQQIAGVGGWSLEAATGEVYISDDLFHTFNTTDRTDLPVYPDTLRLYIHPDYWPAFKTAVDTALAGGAEVDMQTRMFMPGDIPYFVHIKSISVRDEAGKVVRLVGMIQDITARVAIDDAYHESRLTLSLVQEMTHTVTWSYDAATQMVMFSEDFPRVFGCDSQRGAPIPLDQVVEHCVQEDSLLLLERVRQALSDERDFDLTLRLRADKKEARQVRIRGAAIRSTSGHVTRLVGAMGLVTGCEDSMPGMSEERG